MPEAWALPAAGILAATVLIGPLLDKLGAKPVLAVGLGLITVALASMPSLASYPALAAAALLYGFGGGILNTATNALVSELSAAGRRVALNLLGFSFSLGAVTAPLLMSLARGGFPLPRSSRCWRRPGRGTGADLALRFPGRRMPARPSAAWCGF